MVQAWSKRCIGAEPWAGDDGSRQEPLGVKKSGLEVGWRGWHAAALPAEGILALVAFASWPVVARPFSIVLTLLIDLIPIDSKRV